MTKPDFQTRMFWEEVVRLGPMGLTRHDWSDIERKLDETTRSVLGRVLADLESEARWIEEQRRAMREEAERIAVLGETMRKAGLRSYTDKEGRIFIAAPKRSTPER